jgi:predicted transcriptional regulator
MASRDSLHRIVDDLPETEIARAERLLEVLKETAEPRLYTLESAPADDEPETAEEAAAVAEAWRDHKAGKSLTTEELMRKLDLA